MPSASRANAHAGGPGVRVTAHPPERRGHGTPVTLAAGGCCCCCCCCLHSVGGLIGGIAGSVRPIERVPRQVLDPDFPFPFRRDEEELIDAGLPPSLLYWLLVGVLIVVTVVVTYFNMMPTPTDAVFAGLFVSLMILPALQLGASLLAVIVVALVYPDKDEAFRRIGKITWWSFAGGMIGLLAMGGCCLIFSTLRL